jgi:hypothetical protein
VDRELISVDITDTPEPYDEVTEGEIETARILGIDPMHLHRILDLHSNVLRDRIKARMAQRLASGKRTVV